MDLYGVNFFIFGSKPGQGQFEPRKDLRGLDHIGFKVKDLAKATADLKGKRRKVQRGAVHNRPPESSMEGFIDGPDGMGPSSWWRGSDLIQWKVGTLGKRYSEIYRGGKEQIMMKKRPKKIQPFLDELSKRSDKMAKDDIVKRSKILGKKK